MTCVWRSEWKRTVGTIVFGRAVLGGGGRALLGRRLRVARHVFGPEPATPSSGLASRGLGTSLTRPERGGGLADPGRTPSACARGRGPAAGGARPLQGAGRAAAGLEARRKERGRHAREREAEAEERRRKWWRSAGASGADGEARPPAASAPSTIAGPEHIVGRSFQRTIHGGRSRAGGHHRRDRRGFRRRWWTLARGSHHRGLLGAWCGPCKTLHAFASRPR
jgi:hypothetical protein